eukprot:Rmarinus@m.21548
MMVLRTKKFTLSNLIALVLLLWAFGTSSGCTLSEMQQTAVGLFDASVFASLGCVDVSFSRECCDASLSTAMGPCFSVYIEFAEGANKTGVHFARSLLQQCRIELGYGYNFTACGNGILDDFEQCDLGIYTNTPGSGCSDCFMDNGYDCFSADSSTPGTTPLPSFI